MGVAPSPFLSLTRFPAQGRPTLGSAARVTEHAFIPMRDILQSNDLRGLRRGLIEAAKLNDVDPRAMSSSGSPIIQPSGSRLHERLQMAQSGSSDVATIRSFSAADQRVRRCTEVITSTRAFVM